MLIAVVGIVGSAIGIAWPSRVLIEWAVSSNTTTSNKELAYWNWLKIVLLREGVATISHRCRANLQWANISRYVLLRDNILCNLTCIIHLVHLLPKVEALRLILYHVVKATPTLQVVETHTLCNELAAALAADVVCRAIEATEQGHWYGVSFEKVIPWLSTRF